MTLRRVIVEFSPDGIQLRTLYRSTDCPGPSTKARRREVEQLAREGLRQALDALEEGPVEDLGTSGYTVREDTLGLVTSWRPGDPMTRVRSSSRAPDRGASHLRTSSPDAQKTMKRGA